MSAQLNELRMQIERLDYENKEAAITVDILREQNQDLTADLEEQKQLVEDLQSTQRDPSEEDKEKKKAEKMAMMMAQFDTVRSACFLPSFWVFLYSDTWPLNRVFSLRKKMRFAQRLISWTLLTLKILVRP